MADINDYQGLLDRVKKLERGEKLDLSAGEDLSIGIMNLISIEEHLFFSAQKTNKSEYLDLLAEVRQMRKELLQRIIKDYEGEVWCISKHLLAASMRLMEVGTKLQGKKDPKGAAELFAKSYQLYSLFWGLNLGVVGAKDLKHQESDKVELLADGDRPQVRGSVGLFDKLGTLVQKVLDCCRE